MVSLTSSIVSDQKAVFKENSVTSAHSDEKTIEKVVITKRRLIERHIRLDSSYTLITE